MRGNDGRGRGGRLSWRGALVGGEADDGAQAGMIVAQAQSAVVEMGDRGDQSEAKAGA